MVTVTTFCAITTSSLYDTRNRLAQILHKNGATVVQGWDYDLDDAGNIWRMASSEAGSEQAWEYLYDGRSRLAHALRRNTAGAPSLSCAYDYDAGDNLVEKKTIPYLEEWTDDFSDGDFSNDETWSVVSGTWSAASNYLTGTTSGISYIEATQTAGDALITLRYRCLDDSNGLHAAAVFPRYVDSNNYLAVTVAPGSASVTERSGGANGVSLSNSDTDTEEDKDYLLYILCQSDRLDVWRRNETDNGPLERIFGTEDLTVNSSGTLRIFALSGNTYLFDDIQVYKIPEDSTGLYDSFHDGDYTSGLEWSTTGTWTIDSQGFMKNASDPVYAQEFGLDFTQSESAEYWFSYRIDYDPGGGSPARARMIARRNALDNERLQVAFYQDRAVLNQQDGGTWTVLDQDLAQGCSLDTWYDVYMKTDGPDVEVWRAERGQTMTKVLESSSATVTSGPRIYFDASPASLVQYDDIRIANNDGQVRSFGDDLQDGNLTQNPAWTVNGAWTVPQAGGNYYAHHANEGVWRSLIKEAEHGDVQIRFKYRLNNALDSTKRATITFRSDPVSGERVGVSLMKGSARMEQYVPGFVQLALNNNASITENVWYDVLIIADGKKLEVWRAPVGETMSRILATGSAGTSVLAGKHIYFQAGPDVDVDFDDIHVAVDESVTTQYQHNAANELLAMLEDDALTAYTYDDWGRTLTKTQSASETTHVATYLYSFGDKLKMYETTFPGEQDVSYNYDGLGKRRNKAVHSDATWWRWAGWSILSEYDGGAVEGGWDPGTRQLGYIPGLAQFTHDSGAGTYDYNFYLQDHLGSTRNVLDESKTLLARLSYTPYGEELQFAGNLPSPRYTGHHWDVETGMYFAPLRYYMPGSGRWLSRDPLGFGDGANRYLYVSDDPIGHVDPSGGVGVLVCLAVGAVVVTGLTVWAGFWDGGDNASELGGTSNRRFINEDTTGGPIPGYEDYTPITISPGVGETTGPYLDGLTDSNQQEYEPDKQIYDVVSQPFAPSVFKITPDYEDVKATKDACSE